MKARDSAAAQLAASEQTRAQADADLQFATKERAREQAMVARHAAAQRDLDQAQSTFDSDAAKLAAAAANSNSAKAALAIAEWNLSQRVIKARTQGRIEDVYFRVGEYAQANTPVVAVLPPQNIYVRFFVPETELNTLKPGQDVTITCDSCGDNLKAKISFIASEAEFTPPVIYSVGNREKLVFKVEARAALGLPLRPGLPVAVTLNE